MMVASILMVVFWLLLVSVPYYLHAMLPFAHVVREAFEIPLWTATLTVIVGPFLCTSALLWACVRFARALETMRRAYPMNLYSNNFTTRGQRDERRQEQAWKAGSHPRFWH